MGSGFQGTLALAWSQTELDGLQNAPLDALVVGAIWCWDGQPIRLDGPRDLLFLQPNALQRQTHARAARRVRRLPGMRGARPADLPGPAGDAADPAEDAPPSGHGFTLTDGLRKIPVQLVGGGDQGPLIAVFPQGLPPARTDLWVIQVNEPARRLSTGRPGDVVCFAGGTRLRTPLGPRLIDRLVPGDKVMTRDDGAQEILWVGSSRVSGARLLLHPELRPIRIHARALGLDLPDAELLLSPRHRVLLGGRAAMALFNAPEVLASAADLVNDHSIRPVSTLREVTYHHLLLARHQVVWANELPCETFHPQDMPLEGIDALQRAELLGLYPDLTRDPGSYGTPARRLLSRGEVAVYRHDSQRPFAQ